MLFYITTTKTTTFHVYIVLYNFHIVFFYLSPQITSEDRYAFTDDEPEAQKDKVFAQGCTANRSLEPLTLNLMLFYHPTLTNEILLLCFCNIASVVKILQPPLPWSKINYSLLNRGFYSAKDWGI